MNPWRQFFDHYATKYDHEVFTKNTDAEVAFLIEHLALKPGDALLDLGCGTGRHSVPLARFGCRVTGVDISQGMLDVATARAREAGVQPRFVCADATTFVEPEAFDAAICLCEGAICLIAASDDPIEHDMTILRNIHASLRPGGTAIVNVLSALRVIREAPDGFDPMTLTVPSDIEALAPELDLSDAPRERHYTPTELRRMALDAGFTVRGIHGGTAGDWGLRPVTLDEYELMLIATK